MGGTLQACKTSDEVPGDTLQPYKTVPEFLVGILQPCKTFPGIPLGILHPYNLPPEVSATKLQPCKPSKWVSDDKYSKGSVPYIIKNVNRY